MPIVGTQIVTDRGIDLQSGPGLANLMVAMLWAGTASRSALVLSDELEGLGALYDSWANHHGMGVSGQCLQNQFSELFALLADIVRNPAFDSTELEGERTKHLSSIAACGDDPEALLDNAMAELLYPPTHPFHAPLNGDEATIRAAEQEDLAALHLQAFRPAHTTVAIAGAIDRDSALRLVEKNFGSWTGEALPPTLFPDAPIPEHRENRFWLIDRPGALQSNILLGKLAISRDSVDYDAVMVLNTLLGGQFSSRLNLNLREKHAFSYGAYSIVEARTLPGPWTAGAAVTTPSTAAAIREMFVEIERFQHELVPLGELQNAKTNLIRKLPARFETAAGTAQSLGVLALLRLPLDVFATRQSRVAQVTSEDIQRVAKLYLQPEAMCICVVGDAALIREDLEKLNFGPIEVRQAIEADLDLPK
jgi:zinc protease